MLGWGIKINVNPEGKEQTLRATKVIFINGLRIPETYNVKVIESRVEEKIKCQPW